MEHDAGNDDAEAGQDGEAPEEGLAAAPSTSTVLNVELGADGVVMPTPTTVDTTRLTGALVGLQLRERVQGGRHRAATLSHILGVSHAQDGGRVCVIELANETIIARPVDAVRACINTPSAQTKFDLELQVLDARAELAGMASRALIARPDVPPVSSELTMSRSLLKKVRALRLVPACHVATRSDSDVCYSPFFVHACVQELVRVHKRLFLSHRQGFLWTGTDAEAHVAYQTIMRRNRRRPADSARNVRARSDTRGVLPARTIGPILALDASACARAAYIDLGLLGARVARAAWHGHPPTSADSTSARCLCTYCGALLFKDEREPAPTLGPYATVWCGKNLCCSYGAVRLDRIERDSAMEELWANETHAKTLAKHARELNNAMALASHYASTPSVPGSSTWRPAVSIQGKLHHRISSLQPQAQASGQLREPRFAQIYVHDPALPHDPSALRLEGQTFRALTRPETERVRQVLTSLHTILTTCNPYVQDVITAGEIFAEAGESVPEVTFAIGNEVCAWWLMRVHNLEPSTVTR